MGTSYPKLGSLLAGASVSAEQVGAPNPFMNSICAHISEHETKRPIANRAAQLARIVDASVQPNQAGSSPSTLIASTSTACGNGIASAAVSETRKSSANRGQISPPLAWDVRSTDFTGPPGRPRDRSPPSRGTQRNARSHAAVSGRAALRGHSPHSSPPRPRIGFPSRAYCRDVNA